MKNLILILLSTDGVWWELLIAGTLTALPFALLLICYFVLAEKNIIFTFTRENQIMHIMYAKTFSGKAILKSKDYCIEKVTYDIKKKSEVEEENQITVFSFLGAFLVGVPGIHTIYERWQEWQEWKIEEVNGEIRQKMILRKEKTPYLFIKPTEYAMALLGAKDSKGVSYNIKFTVIIQAVNAYKPIFGNEDALGQLKRFAITEALLFVKKQTFETLGAQTSKTKVKKSNKNDGQKINDKFSQAMCQLNEDIPGDFEEPSSGNKKGIREVLGYQINYAKLDTIDIADDDNAGIREATTKKYKAEQDRETEMIIADGKMKAKLKEIKSKKAEMDINISYRESLSKIPGASEIEKFEKIEKSKIHTLVLGKETVTTLNLNNPKKEE
jgi:hypothetical protein